MDIWNDYYLVFVHPPYDLSLYLLRRPVGSKGRTSPALAPAFEIIQKKSSSRTKHNTLKITILIIWRVISQIELKAKKKHRLLRARTKQTSGPRHLSQSLSPSLLSPRSPITTTLQRRKRIQALVVGWRTLSKTSRLFWSTTRSGRAGNHRRNILLTTTGTTLLFLTVFKKVFTIYVCLFDFSLWALVLTVLCLLCFISMAWLGSWVPLLHAFGL